MSEQEEIVELRRLMRKYPHEVAYFMEKRPLGYPGPQR